MRSAARPTVSLTPAMMFWLMVGRDPGARLHGWAAFFQAGLYGEPTPAEAWADHAELLTAEAARHGFEPYWLHRRVPRGPTFEAWRAQFVATQRY